MHPTLFHPFRLLCLITTTIFLIIAPAFSLDDLQAQTSAPGRGIRTNQAIITDLWGIELQPGVDPLQFASQHGWIFEGQVANLPNTYAFRILGTGAPVFAIDQAARDTATLNAEQLNANIASVTLSSDPIVVDFTQQVAEVISPQQNTERQNPPLPTDPLYPLQWHLNNTGQFFEEIGAGTTPGEDANVLGAWQAGYTGAGVQIAIVDDGVEGNHPDLIGNYRFDLDYDFVSNSDTLSLNPDDTHGTSVAGIAAADDDGSNCGVGAAYDAQITGLRFLNNVDIVTANALSHELDVIDIYNNSWSTNNENILWGQGQYTQQALRNNILYGRNQLGNIYVFSAGNGRTYGDAGADTFSSSPYTIAVSATGEHGQHLEYSERGAAILVNAPSGEKTRFPMFTTDRMGNIGESSYDCLANFDGTSASAPLVSGIIALMLQANPNLTYRDVMHILVNTADKNDPTDSGWMINGGGHDIHRDYYGFGRVDAAEAVAVASTWTNVGPATIVSQNSPTLNISIPNLDSVGISDSLEIHPFFGYNRVEHVEVTFYADHLWDGDLEIILTSPSGTQSRLIQPRSGAWGNQYLNGWTFTSVQFWDEPAAGTWTLTVKDMQGLISGTFKNWGLRVYTRQGEVGIVCDPDRVVIHTPSPYTQQGPHILDLMPSALSYDGSKVVYETLFRTSVAGIPETTYSYNRTTCKRANTSFSPMYQSPAAAQEITISGNGRFVAFTTGEIVPFFSPYIIWQGIVGTVTSEIYVVDLVTNFITPASYSLEVNDQGIPLGGNGSDTRPTLSADGSRVAFQSNSTNLVPGMSESPGHIFVRDIANASTILVSASSDGTPGNGNSFIPSISPDGRYIVFVSSASNLVPGDTTDLNIFIKNIVTQEIVRIPAPEGSVRVYHPDISADGQFVVFEAVYDTEAEGSAIYLYERATNRSIRITPLAAVATRSENPSISDDGRYIVYSSNYGSTYTWDISQIWIFDRITGENRRVSRNVAGEISWSGWPNYGVSSAPSISGDGQYVAFISHGNNLTPDDDNGSVDIFTSRWQGINYPPELITPLSGSIQLQGRPTVQSPSLRVPLQIRAYDQNGTMVFNQTVYSDDQANLIIPNLPVGSATVWIKHPQALAVSMNVDVAQGMNVPFGQTHAGDADNSNSINLIDFSLLASSFSKSSDQPGFDARADFNGDNQVNLIDFSLLASNYGQAGANLP